jgi:hypothetical protein
MKKLLFITIILNLLLTTGLFAEASKDIGVGNNYFFITQDLKLYAQADELNEDLFSMNDNTGNRKSASKAILLSLAVPGLGELYAGNTKRAVGFFLAEAGVWSTFLLFKHKEQWLEDDYINYAISNAGINPDGKPEFFFDMVGFYDNRDEYNKNSRVYSRSNEFFPEIPEWDWQWQSPEMRHLYREIKNDSKAQARNANFVLGLALANRVVSAVDAWWCAKSYNRQFSPLISRIKLHVTPSLSDLARGNSTPGFMLSYRHTF